MHLSYYQVLTISYLVSIGIWWLLSFRFPGVFIAKNIQPIKKPWFQTVLLFVCIIVTIAIGRLPALGFSIPDFKLGSLNISECMNQVLIYSPFPLFLVFTKQSLSSAWFPQHKIITRFASGLALSLIAIFVFVLLANANSFIAVLSEVFHPQNTHHFVQVFLEDFSIALLLSRISAAFTSKYFIWAVAVVAGLFSFGHLPSNLEAGVPIIYALTNLSMDAILVFIAGMALYRSKDFLWLFPIHFAMDMMQFYSGLTISD